MKIETIVVGDLETNCYLLTRNSEVLIIDPGDDFSKIKNAVGNKKVVGCLLTHNHFDHVGALNDVLDYYHLKVNDYQKDNFKYTIIKTPGHTNDSITFYFKEENVMFVGDFIFYHNIGRTDLGGNDLEMINSLNLIKTYPDNTIIYPGHGQSTILSEEKKRFSLYY